MFAVHPYRSAALCGLLAAPMLIAATVICRAQPAHANSPAGPPAGPPPGPSASPLPGPSAGSSASLSASAPPSGGSGPMRVTTDTPEYCVELSERVSHAERAMPSGGAKRLHRPEVDELAAEGEHMCAAGLIRGGLLRLRRAWMLLRSGE